MVSHAFIIAAVPERMPNYGIGRLPYTNIAVDFFKAQSSVQHYFLTHMHSAHHILIEYMHSLCNFVDHLEGLVDEWNFGIIYCSPVSKKLLLKRFRIKDCIIIGLELGKSHEIMLDKQNTTMQVTVISANHCPGYFGRILYTGDFRFQAGMITPDMIQSPIDYLYFDNTFCDPRFIFPPQAEVKDNILSVIRQHPNHDIVIGIDNLGKEELLVFLALELDTQIVVSPQRLQEIETIDYLPHSFFTSDTSKGYIKLAPRGSVTEKNVLQWNSRKPTIGIVPSGWSYSFSKEKEVPFATDKHVFYFPYSLHSSFDELKEFIILVRPRRLIPIVPTHHTDISYFAKYLDPSPLTEVKIMDGIYSNTADFYEKVKELESTSLDSPVPRVRPNQIYSEDVTSPDATSSEDVDSQDPCMEDLQPSTDEKWIEEARVLVQKFYPVVPNEFIACVEKQDLTKWSNEMDALIVTHIKPPKKHTHIKGQGSFKRWNSQQRTSVNIN